MDPDEEESLIAEDERFKVALHYTIGKLSQKAVEDREKRELDRFIGHHSQVLPVEFTKTFVAALTEVTHEMIGNWATDLEAFAKHAKRSTINADDVRLLTLRSPALRELLDRMIESPENAASTSIDADNASNHGQNRIDQHRAKKSTKNTAASSRISALITNDHTMDDESTNDTFDAEGNSMSSPPNHRRLENGNWDGDDDLDHIMMAIDEDQIRGGRSSTESRHETSWDQFKAPLPPTTPRPISNPPNVVVEEEEPWIMPSIPSAHDVTLEDIERRRRSAQGDEFSLAGFDDKWWE